MSIAELESLFLKKARNEPLSIDEIGELAAVDPDEVKRQVARVGRVIKHQALAGTAAEREAARQTLAHATARLKTEAPDIAGEIGKLQAKQRELEAGVKSAEQVVTRHENACRVLRENAPDHVKQFCANARSLLRQQLSDRPKLAERVKLLKSIPQIDVNTNEGRAQAIQHAQAYGRKECVIEERKANNVTLSLDAKRWAAYVEQLQAELPATEAASAKMEAEYAGEIAKLERALDLYIPA